MFTVPVSAQSIGRFKGRSSQSKREVKKRKMEAEQKQAEDTPFAPTPKSGRLVTEIRDDYIWKSQSGGVVYPKAGNISFFEPAKIGLNDKSQLESSLGVDYWIPNLFYKYQWYSSKEWKVATRHGLYSGTPGYNYFDAKGVYKYTDTAQHIPIVLSCKNELFITRLFTKAYSCNGPQPYLLITGGLGFDLGYPMGKNDLSEIHEPFLGNRSMALCGNGYMVYALIRGDYQINPSFLAGASFRYFYGNFTGNHAMEPKLWIETFLGDNVSITTGISLSFDSYDNSPEVGFLPILDLTYYFGRKKGRESGLFNKPIY